MLRFPMSLVGILVPVFGLCLSNDHGLFPVDCLSFHPLPKLYGISNLSIELVASLTYD